MKTKKKRFSLKFSPVFSPKFGQAQIKALRLSFVYSKLLPNLQRGGPCRNFAYYSMLIILTWRPKGGAWPNGPSPPKYAPVSMVYKTCAEIFIQTIRLRKSMTTGQDANWSKGNAFAYRAGGLDFNSWAG